MDLTPPPGPSASPDTPGLEQLAAHLSAEGLTVHEYMLDGELDEIIVCAPGCPGLNRVTVDSAGSLAWDRYTPLGTSTGLQVIARVIAVLLDADITQHLTVPPAPGPLPPPPGQDTR